MNPALTMPTTMTDFVVMILYVHHLDRTLTSPIDWFPMWRGLDGAWIVLPDYFWVALCDGRPLPQSGCAGRGAPVARGGCVLVDMRVWPGWARTPAGAGARREEESRAS